MDVIGVIPARYGSSRFEGKVLADIHGKPMLQWVWEAAKKAKILDEVIIACDDRRIEEAVQSFGGKAVFTSKEHPSGTDRICEVVNPLEVKVVVNIQADEPLIEPVMIENVARPLLDMPQLNMATLMKEIDDPQEISDPNVVKVLTDKDGLALYFSRASIPYHRDRPEGNGAASDSRSHSQSHRPEGKHIGLYAYTKDFLFIFKNLPESNLERIEKLEQLRVLEQGFRIKVIETKISTIGVDVPADLEKVRKALANK
jgi:3-deoxy-manno-octulosonate cytidylyltransferase (CMP-KDO synthetase)